MKWKVGEVAITSIVEQPLHALNAIMPTATPEVLGEMPWLRPHYVDDQGVMSGIIQAFIIDTGALRIVVDTCIGDDRDRFLVEEWNHMKLDALSKFGQAGYPPESIDYVMCTHLHVDHVGWNTRFDGARFVPSFPNARYLFERSEFEFWQTQARQPDPRPTAGSEPLDQLVAGFKAMQQTVFADSIQPVVDAGLVDLVSGDHCICDSVKLKPTPGHSPGHVSVEIHSGGASALLTGDAIHHPCQIGRPDIYTVADEYPEQGVVTRGQMLEQACGDGRLVIGSHFSTPSGGRIRKEAKGYRFVPDRT